MECIAGDTSRQALGQCEAHTREHTPRLLRRETNLPQSLSHHGDRLRRLECMSKVACQKILEVGMRLEGARLSTYKCRDLRGRVRNVGSNHRPARNQRDNVLEIVAAERIARTAIVIRGPLLSKERRSRGVPNGYSRRDFGKRRRLDSELIPALSTRSHVRTRRCQVEQKTIRPNPAMCVRALGNVLPESKDSKVVLYESVFRVRPGGGDCINVFRGACRRERRLYLENRRDGATDIDDTRVEIAEQNGKAM